MTIPTRMPVETVCLRCGYERRSRSRDFPQVSIAPYRIEGELRYDIVTRPWQTVAREVTYQVAYALLVQLGMETTDAQWSMEKVTGAYLVSEMDVYQGDWYKAAKAEAKRIITGHEGETDQ